MVLWALTGRRFGCCEVTVRPCKPDPECQGGLSDLIYWDRGIRGLDNLGVSMTPLLIDGDVFNISCGCLGACTCKAPCEFFLPGPICAVTEVKVGDTVLDPSAYTVYDHTKLVFLSGTDCPDCQNYDLPLGMDGTWSATYTIGEPLPPGANLMAGLLACEFGKALADDGSCGLSSRVQGLVRQGISIELPDPVLLAEKGLTGHPTVDLWVKALNPYGMAQKPRVWSPDLPVVRRET